MDRLHFWCQKVLPLAYDNSLSYYELLCKVVDYLNNVISDMIKLGVEVDKIKKQMYELQEYVDNYFKNLDVQEEIDKKLDEMFANGQLEEILKKSTTIRFFMNPVKEDTTDYYSDFCGGIVTPNKVLLVDTGRGVRFETIKNNLLSIGITKIDYIVLTHMDGDHVEGLSGIVNNFDVTDCVVYTPVIPQQLDKIDYDPTFYYEQVQTILKAKNIPLINPTEGQKISLDNGVTFTLNNCSEKYYQNYYVDGGKGIYNNFSMTVLVNYGFSNIYFTADIQYKAMKQLVNVAPSHPIIMTAPHHGATSSFNREFVQKTYGNNYIMSNVNRNFTYRLSGEWYIEKEFNCFSYGADYLGGASNFYYADITYYNTCTMHGNPMKEIPYNYQESRIYPTIAIPKNTLFTESDVQYQPLTVSINNVDITNIYPKIQEGDILDTIVNTNTGNTDFWNSLNNILNRVPKSFADYVCHVVIQKFATSIVNVTVDSQFCKMEQQYLNGVVQYTRFTITNNIGLKQVKELSDFGNSCVLYYNGYDGRSFNMVVPSKSTILKSEIKVGGLKKYAIINLSDQTFKVIPINESQVNINNYLSSVFEGFLGENIVTTNVFSTESITTLIPEILSDLYTGIQRIGASGCVLTLFGENHQKGYIVKFSSPTEHVVSPLF